MNPSLISDGLLSTLVLALFGIDGPVAIVLVVSLVVGLLMVLLFGYTSDQKAIHVAKDRLKAHLLAVRLYQDQLPVVIRTYGRILRGTGSYLRLAFMPLLYVIIPITLLIVQLDRYLGMTPLRTAQPFLVTVRAAAPDVINDVSLQLPQGMAISAPAVHIPAENTAVWRVVPEKNGTYDINVTAAGQAFSKRVLVSPDLSRLSPVRLRGHFWERMFVSAEPELPANAPLESIAVTYPPRLVDFAWMEWNWIVLFFVLSMVAGFIFKEVLGIEI